MKLAIIFTLIGCNAWVRPDPPPPGLRTPSEQQMYAVKVESECFDFFKEGTAKSVGTGVMVSDWQVLTALHVVDCFTDLPVIHVTTSKGRWRFSPEKEWRGRDIARIQIASADSLRQKVKPPAIRLTPIDSVEHVYIQAAHPYADEVFGLTTGYSSELSFSYKGLTQKGNSGSGVYDINNRLVGIHVRHATGTNTSYASYVTSDMIPR